MHVLEALLRLRQAACHPGLVDRKRQAETSAKFDVLLPRLREVVDEGHKALVFSQFTSLLALLRTALDAEGFPTSISTARRAIGPRASSAFRPIPTCRCSSSVSRPAASV